eukprot:TRINITY_DN9814_c0_g2_i2.p1 TRINITY_DN9814_c0_g2~~TRINITY_DN9814_c0_g2_i2.p1  ORF type:complete len:949 (+),score=157.79 TRINITY_DN9814_c0_g2_i2:74-2848(+)
MKSKYFHSNISLMKVYRILVIINYVTGLLLNDSSSVESLTPKRTRHYASCRHQPGALFPECGLPFNISNFQEYYLCDWQRFSDINTTTFLWPLNRQQLELQSKDSEHLKAMGTGYSWNHIELCVANKTKKAHLSVAVVNTEYLELQPLYAEGFLAIQYLTSKYYSEIDKSLFEEVDNDYLLLKNFHIDFQRRTVRVAAGVPFRVLLDFLSQVYEYNQCPHGCTLPTYPSFIDMTVGGAVATGSHGSSLSHGSLSSHKMAKQITMIRDYEKGEDQWSSRQPVKVTLDETWEAWWLASLVSIGQVGVIDSVSFKMVPIKQVVRTTTELDFSQFMNEIRNWTEFYLMTLVDTKMDDWELSIQQTAVLSDLDNNTHFFWLPYTYQVYRMDFEVKEEGFEGARETIEATNLPRPRTGKGGEIGDEAYNVDSLDSIDYNADALSSFAMPFSDLYVDDFDYYESLGGYDDYFSDSEMMAGINNVMNAFGITYDEGDYNDAYLDELMNFANMGRLGGEEVFELEDILGGRRKLLQLIRDEISVPTEFFIGLDEDLYQIEDIEIIVSDQTASKKERNKKLYEYYINQTNINTLLGLWEYTAPQALWKMQSLAKLKPQLWDLSEGPPLFLYVEEWQKLFTAVMKEWVQEDQNFLQGTHKAFQELNPFYSVIRQLQGSNTGSYSLPFEQIEMAIPIEMAGQCLTHIGGMIYNTSGKANDWIFPITIRFQGQEEGFLSVSVDGPQMLISTEYPFAEIDNSNLFTNNSLVIDVFDYLFINCEGRLNWGLSGWEEFGSCFDGYDRYGDNWCRFGCAAAHMDPKDKFSSQAEHIWQWYAKNQLVWVQEFGSACCDEGGLFNLKWCQCSSHPEWDGIEDCRIKARLKQDTPNKNKNPLPKEKELGGEIDSERILDIFSNAKQLAFDVIVLMLGIIVATIF